MTERDLLAALLHDELVRHGSCWHVEVDRWQCRSAADRLLAAGVTLTPAPLALDLTAVLEAMHRGRYGEPWFESLNHDPSALRGEAERFITEYAALAAPQAPDGEAEG